MTEQPFRRAFSDLPSAAAARLDEVIRKAVPTVAPAVAVSIWRSGEPWYRAHAGWVGPQADARPVRDETIFDLASLTKLFTATVFLGLAEEAGLDIDEPVTRVLPEFATSGPRGVDGGQEPLSRRVRPTPPERVDWRLDPASVTFRQLLTHTGGLAPWRSIFRDTGPAPPPPDESDPVTPAERREAGLRSICDAPFVARPGQECHYSDLGFMLLGEVVSRLSEGPLDQAMVDRVFEPLGLDSLTYVPVRTGRARGQVVPTSFDGDWRRRRCWGEVEDENAAGLGGVAGHAGLFATADDVARFGVAWWRQDPRLGLGRYGSEAVTERTGALGAARGLGWQVQPTDHLAPFGATAFGHTGFTGTSLAVDPARDLVVALLTNRVYAGRIHQGIDELRLAVADAAVGAPRR